MSGVTLTPKLAEQLGAALRKEVEKMLDERSQETARLLGRIELRLSALEALTGQGKSVDTLIDEAIERLQAVEQLTRRAQG